MVRPTIFGNVTFKHTKWMHVLWSPGNRWLLSISNVTEKLLHWIVFFFKLVYICSLGKL